ncbi:MAG: hypothetical protein ACFFE4_20945 [Candidatus Thorarchaeota archaeon]
MKRIRALISQGYVSYAELLPFFPGLNQKQLEYIIQTKMRGINKERNELYFRPRAIQMIKDNRASDEHDLLFGLGFKQTKTSKNSYYYGSNKNVAWNKLDLIKEILGMNFQSARRLHNSNTL